MPRSRAFFEILEICVDKIFALIGTLCIELIIHPAYQQRLNFKQDVRS